MIWATQHSPRFAVPVRFLYDAQAAGQGTFGAAKPVQGTSPEAYSALTAFATSLRHYLSVLVTVEHEHVTGHAGHLGNELCDALAKIARKGPQDLFDRCMPTWPSKWAKHPLSEWAWATLPHQPDVPRLFCFDTEVTLSQMQPPTSVEAPEYGLEHVKHPAADAQFVLTCISLNVLTLRDPKPQQVPTGVGLCLLGRKDLLKQSLAPYTPLFIGLQETRIPETSVQPDPDYLIFNAACNAKGDYGCALWISKHVPLYSTPEGPVFVQRPDVTVVGVSPRHLTAHIQTPRLSLQVQVFHAPSTASFPIAEVRDFWDARATEVIGRSQGADYLILCDANARLGNVISDYVGEHGAEDEGEAGELLHEFLTKVDALAPSTWACWHHGPHHTWCSPHGSLSRIDYVLVPFPWQHAHLESRTLPDVELMQLREDHVPVLLTCRFCKQLPPQAYSQARSCTVRPDLTARGPHASSLLQQHVPITVWATDVDEHYQALATAWQAFGHTLSPDCTTAVQQPYLTQATYTHVLERRQLRALLRIGAEERRRRWMLIGFAVFIVHARQAAFSPRQQQTADHWLCIMDWDEASLLARYRQLARVLRRSVAEDRTAYLASLAQEVADGNIGDPKSLYRVLRRAFPAARPSRRQALTPLPMLRLPDGSLASDTETRAETWRAHFASQEVGLLTNADDYAADFATQQLVPRSLDIQIVPTLRALERHILATKVCKAAGPDGITAELLKLHVPSTARQLLPVLIKASLRVQEPIVFRGGSLVCLAKRAGLALSCESYRSILVSSIPGKLYHRHVRETLKPLLLDSQMDFQAGVAPGQGIEGISLAVRSFFALCQTGGTCASISFFDLQAAFYQVLREALVPATDDDAGLLRVLHALQLPPAAVTELHEHLQHAAQLPLLGASCHVTATIQDLFRGTWFRLSGFTALTLTKRGSRPGDPTADLLFGFTLSALFKSVHQALDTRGLCPEIPHTSSRPDCLGDCESVLLGFPAWADDFVAPQTGEDTSSLVHRTGQTVSTVIDFATAAGMTVKFGRDKTALLFPPAVLRQERDLFELDAEGCLCLPLRNSVTDVSVQVPVVEAYRHLGGVITSTGTPVPDLHFRYAQARGTLRPLRRRLFGAREFPLRTRAFLLRSLVLSRYAHSAAVLLLRAACHVRVWEQHYVALWRSLFHRRSPSTQLHSFRVLHDVHAPSPPLALARARAGFLRRVVVHGPRALLHLMWNHWKLHPASSWLKQVQSDIGHISQYVPSVQNVLGHGDAVASLLEACHSDPMWWTLQVRAAERAFYADLVVWNNEKRLGADSAAFPSPSAPCSYSCYLCEAQFPLRKHLYAHLARTHLVFSPTRHYALHNVCTACLKVFPGVIQVQQHLKHSSNCLSRCVFFPPPLTYEQFKTLEEPARVQTAKIARGEWRAFRGLARTTRAQQSFGPRLPTAAERTPAAVSDSDPLTSLSKGFVPDASHVIWISEYIEGRSKEGQRQNSHRFWDRRPTSHLLNL